MDQNLSAPAGAVNGCPVVFMRQAFRRNDAVLGMNETEIHQLSEETAALRSNVNDNEAGISANVTDIAANNSAAATNATSIGATQVSLTTNTVGIATNTATLAVVTGDYLTSAEQILLLLLRFLLLCAGSVQLRLDRRLPLGANLRFSLPAPVPLRLLILEAYVRKQVEEL